MDEQQEVLCELWPEEQVEIKPHSRLHHLEPQGIGSPMVESLTSYITRLGEAHSVYTNKLVKKEIWPELQQTFIYKNSYITYSYEATLWRDSRAINGLSSSTSDWVRVLEQLTQWTDLRSLTLVSWRNVLSPIKLLRPIRAWCPLCYEEMRQASLIVHEPLLWSIQVIRVCNRHHLKLQNRCPYPDCQRSQLPLESRGRIGYCAYCLRWLGSPTQVERSKVSDSLSDDEWEWQQFVQKAIGEMLASVAQVSSIPPREKIALALQRFVSEQCNGRINELARQLQMNMNSVKELYSGLQTPQLETLLRICSFLGHSPLELLTGEPGEFKVQRLDGSDTRWTLHTSKRLFRKFDLERVRDALEQVLRLPDVPPPSMRETGRRLGYPAEQIYRYFPDMCREISFRYRAYRTMKKKESLGRKCDEVRQIMYDLYNQGYYPSKNKIEKHLKNPGVFRNPEVRATMHNTLVELGILKS